MTDHILHHWNSRADKYGASPVASWGDHFAIDLERRTIGRYINEGDKILDVGCANGHSTFRHLDKHPFSIVGVDFSASMIREAKKATATHGASENISFEIGDVRRLRFQDETFDVVYTTRTLINLPTWEDQKRGILECMRVCKTGGTVILCEAFWEPLVLLNAMRALESLPALAENDHNRYLKKSYLEDFLAFENIPYELEDFSSIYYLGSRFLRELISDPDESSGYSSPVNELFYGIEREFSGGGFGIQQAYVICKT
ncbi:MAG: class I SAM-dependent methyltransferase [Planctomycetes bacterium]|nr:class I SAM-dependent methyltransferase [Planctomycetota bacterium]